MVTLGKIIWPIFCAATYFFDNFKTFFKDFDSTIKIVNNIVQAGFAKHYKQI